MKHSNRCTVLACGVLVALALALGAPESPAAEAGTLRAGAARVDITPTDFKGLWMVWAKPFTGVHDPIHARALVIDNGFSTALIVATDLVEFGDTTSLRQRIEKETGIPVDHQMIAASHDHNAPRAGPIVAGSSSADGRPYSPPAYVRFVDDRIVEAVRKAKAALQPARVGVGKGRADININRNGYNGRGFGGADPDGPSDKTVWVVKFEDLSGAPIGLLMNYGVHSVVTGPANTLVTGDLAGAAERVVESRLGGNAVALWTMGPAGDQNPRYMSDQREKDEGGRLAYQAMDAQGFVLGVEVWQTAQRITHLDTKVRLAAGESVFTCDTVPKRPPPANPGPPAFAPNADFREQIPYPASMDIHLTLLRINDIAIAGVSGEVFTRIYWHLRKDSPLADTLMVTMSNGRIGYIGDDAAYGNAFGNPSVVKGCAENGIVNGLVDLIRGKP